MRRFRDVRIEPGSVRVRRLSDDINVPPPTEGEEKAEGAPTATPPFHF